MMHMINRFWIQCELDTKDAYSFFFFNDTATTEIYTLSLHDALPIYRPPHGADCVHSAPKIAVGIRIGARALPQHVEGEARCRQGARIALGAPQRLGDGLRIDELPPDRIHCETGERQRGRSLPAAQCGDTVCKHCAPGKPIGDSRQSLGEPEK